jgi:hypothetical protein
VSILFIRFGVLKKVIMQSIIFCDTRMSSLMKVCLRFEGIFYLHLRGRGVSQARNQQLKPQTVRSASGSNSDTLQPAPLRLYYLDV